MIETILIVLVVLLIIWLVWKLSAGIVNIIVMVLVGALIGWLGSQLILGHSQGFLMNLLWGIGGALLGNFLFYIAKIKFNWPLYLDDILRGVVGASLLLLAKKYLHF